VYSCDAGGVFDRVDLKTKRAVLQASVFAFLCHSLETATMTSSASDLFMHPQSCVIEEIVDEPDAPASSSAQADCHSLDASAGAAEDATAEPASTADASQTAEHSDTCDFSQPNAGAAAADAEESAADAAPSGSGSEEQQLDPQTQQLIADCERLKQEGNTQYAQGQYDEALQLYWQVSS
jgi:hypothetical protein